MLNARRIPPSVATVNRERRSDAVEAFRAIADSVPAGADRAIFAAPMELDGSPPSWKVGIVRWSGEAPSAASLARRYGGKVESVGGLEAIRLPSNAYYVRFDTDVGGFITPADRRMVGLWVREVLDHEWPDMSPYLTDAYEHLNEWHTPIVMAMDLSDIVTEADVLAELNNSWNALGIHDRAEQEAVARVLASLRGATLGVTLREEPSALLSIDFGRNVAAIGDIAKPLLMQVLRSRGIDLTEFRDWTFYAEGSRVELEGQFTAAGLQRVFSMIERSPARFETPLAEQTPQSQEALAAQASVGYFHTVADLLTDLRKRSNRTGNHYTVGSLASRYDRYARKIDVLPIQDVDPYVLEYGGQTANTLREAASVIRTGMARTRVRESNAPPIYSGYTYDTTYYDWYPWGPYGSGFLPWEPWVPWQDTQSYYYRDPYAESQQDARIRLEERATTMLEARRLVDSLDKQTADTRRYVAQKYPEELRQESTSYR
jgi:hypothetical protein